MLITIIFFGIAVPFSVLGFRRVRRSPLLMLLVGVSVNVAMFSERVMVVIPMPSRDILTWSNYTPTWVGISISAGAIGLFGFLYTLLTKFIPMVSLWEYKQGAIMEGVQCAGEGRYIVAVREEEIG